MKFVCNLCGMEFENDNALKSHVDDNGTEYYICSECEDKGVELTYTKTYYICTDCGFPHAEEDNTLKCKFCGNKDFAKIELTEPEEAMLDENPNELYKEKLGKAEAKKIADWIESDKRKEVGKRHKRDRHIDTIFVVGILLGYFLLEFDIKNYLHDKMMFLTLLLPTVLVIITAPVFKKFDRKSDKKLPLWILFIKMAVFVDIYWILIKILG